MSTDHLSAWDEVRRLADEVEVQTHLASMDARDRWREIQPRLEGLEQAIVHSGEHTGDVVIAELRAVRDALRGLRDELVMQARGDFAHGW